MKRYFSRYAWGVLAWNIAVVLEGAYVRATGSGAGCGNHWPLCNGVILPRSPRIETIIEFAHRAITGVDAFLVIGLLWMAFRAFPKGHAARLGASLSMLFLVTEGLAGAVLVKLEHVAANPSPWRALSLTFHLVNTLTLLACLALTARWGKGLPAYRVRGRDAVLPFTALGTVVLLGATGVIAALGDTLFPSRTFAEGLARDFEAGASLFVRLRIWHPAIAVFAALVIIWYAVQRLGAARNIALWVMGALCLQVTAGAGNLLLAAPVWLQMVHLLVADVLWIGLVLLVATPPEKIRFAR